MYLILQTGVILGKVELCCSKKRKGKEKLGSFAAKFKPETTFWVFISYLLPKSKAP